MNTFSFQANVTEFLDTEGLPREIGGEDDWQYSWQVFKNRGRRNQNVFFYQPEQRQQPETSEDEDRSWIVAPSDRLVFKAKAEAGGEMETTLTVSNRCQKTTAQRILSSSFEAS